MKLLRLHGLKKIVTGLLIIALIAVVYIGIVAKNENLSQADLKIKPEVIQLQDETHYVSPRTNKTRGGSILEKTNRLPAKQQKTASEKIPPKVHLSGDEWIYLSGVVNETQYTEIAKEEAAKCEEINELINDQDGIFLQEPPIIDILKAANASLSKVRLDKPGSDIVQGSHFTATVTLYDGYGNRLKRGGDMVRARMNSTSLGAYSVGRVMDNTDGTYTVNFTASWVGNVELQFSLAYPKEAIRGLYFQGQMDLFMMSEYYIQDGNQTELTPCVQERAGIHRIRHLGYRSICPYNNGALFCGKPWHMGCANRKRVAWPDQSWYTKAEYNLLKHNWNSHLPKTLYVTIIGNSMNETDSSKQRCTSYNTKSLWNFDRPAGFFFRDKWTSNHCYGGPDTREQLVSCLRNTRVYMFGDSTMHQWYTFLQIALKCWNVTYLESNVKGDLKAETCVDQNRDFFMAYLPHDRDLWSPTSSPNPSTYLNRIPASQEKSIILIHMFTRFVIRHASLIHTRMHMARISIEKLLKRRPNSKVVIKGPHSFQTSCQPNGWCRFIRSDYFAEYFRTIIQMEFKHLSNKIIFLNLLDMSSALELHDVHPDYVFIEKSIKYMLGFTCQ